MRARRAAAGQRRPVPGVRRRHRRRAGLGLRGRRAGPDRAQPAMPRSSALGAPPRLLLHGGGRAALLRAAGRMRDAASQAWCWRPGAALAPAADVGAHRIARMLARALHRPAAGAQPGRRRVVGRSAEPPLPAARAQPVGVARLQLVQERVDGSADVTPPAGSAAGGWGRPCGPGGVGRRDRGAAALGARRGVRGRAMCRAGAVCRRGRGTGRTGAPAAARRAQQRAPPGPDRRTRAGASTCRPWPASRRRRPHGPHRRGRASDDYLLVRTGDEANSIALGRYGSEQAAQRRAAAVQAAGFAARGGAARRAARALARRRGRDRFRPRGRAARQWRDAAPQHRLRRPALTIRRRRPGAARLCASAGIAQLVEQPTCNQ